MTPQPARSACIDTPPGPFTVVVGPDDAVLASGWTADVADLLPVVHRSLRPTWVEPVEHLPALDAVAAFVAGDVTAIDDVPVRQRSGPFLEDAWEVLRTVLRRADYDRDLWAVAPRLAANTTFITDATGINRQAQRRGGVEHTLTSQTDFSAGTSCADSV